ncbi:MAG: hypothetical protein AAF548_00775 [Actinomycetota bacterium]
MVAPPKAPPLWFIHLQKCGGTSLKAAIRRGWAPTHDEEAVVDLDGAAAAQAAADLDIAPFQFRDQISSYYLRGMNTRALMGHFRYTNTVHDQFRGTARMITVLRQPEPRLTSAYFYDRFKVESHGKITERLDEFLLTPEGRPSSRARIHAERFIVMFRGDGSNDHRVASQADIDNAIRNLTALDAVGFLEDLDPFISTLSEWAGEPLAMPVLNKNPASKEDRAELTDRLREVVHEICKPAQIVYDRVRDHFAGG